MPGTSARLITRSSRASGAIGQMQAGQAQDRTSLAQLGRGLGIAGRHHLPRQQAKAIGLPAPLHFLRQIGNVEHHRHRAWPRHDVPALAPVKQATPGQPRQRLFTVIREQP
jgi:hypothetical protein